MHIIIEICESSRFQALHLYWGTATTGRPHVGYLVPMRKLADTWARGDLRAKAR